MYDDVLDDPKVQRLPAEIFRGWINILCLAKRHDGVLPEIDIVSYALRLSEDEATKLLSTLKERKLLDETEDGLVPHNWHRRQYKSDTSTERVKRFRKRERNVSGNGPETETETEETEGETFQEWFRSFPKQTDEYRAHMAYIEARKTESAESLLTAARHYAAEVENTDDQFIKSPANWLDGKCWKNSKKKSNGKAHGIANTMPIECTPEELSAYRSQYPHLRDATEVPSWWLARHRRR